MAKPVALNHDERKARIVSALKMVSSGTPMTRAANHHGITRDALYRGKRRLRAESIGRVE